MRDTETYRHVPYDIEVEQALLGAIIVDNGSLERVDERFRAIHFYDPMHQRVWKAIEKLQRDGAVCTPLTLHAAMKADPGLVEVGGHAYFSGLAQAAPALANVVDLSKILHDLWVRRSLIKIGEDVVNAAYEAPLDLSIADQLQDAEAAIFQLSTRSRNKQHIITSEEAGEEVIHLAEDAMNGKPILAVPTRIKQFDEATGGLHASDVTLMAGRPGMGKTAALATCWKNAGLGGHPALYFSLEMASRQLTERTLCDIDTDLTEEARKNPLLYERFRRGKASPSELERMIRAHQVYRDLPIEICDDANLTVHDIVSISRRFASKHDKLGLIVVDYLQRVRPGDRYQGKRVDELAEVSDELKSLAKKLDWPVLAGVQLSRDIERRPEKERRPTLSDIRACGEIEEDADVVVGLFWPGYYTRAKRPADGPNSAEWPTWQAEWLNDKNRYQLNGMKNRHGSSEGLTAELWCEMGSASLRARDPGFEPIQSDLMGLIP